MKASGKQIAQRYVTALLSVAGDALAQVEKDLSSLQAAYEGSELFRATLSNPLLSRDQQASLMAELLGKIKAHKITQQFIAMVAKQKRLVILPEILACFRQEVAALRGEMAAEVITAGKLSAKDAAIIGERLGNAYGKKIVIDTRQDPELLGGVVVKIGSVQLDGSLSGKLRRLGHKLKAA